MKSFARLYALPKRKTETAAHNPAGGQKVATPPRKATPPPPLPPPPQGSEPPSPPDTHTAKRDAVEAAWQRMQGDDAKATALAAKKLRSYARDADADSVEALLQLTCSTAGLFEATPAVRRERIRLLELLVSSQCPQQAAALASPHLEAVIAYLRACFQENGADDRLGVAEAVGDVAANLAAAGGQELPGELPANPLLQCCFEALSDPRPEVQDCAAASLGQMLPFVASMPGGNVKTLLKHLNSASFAAKARLIKAFASHSGRGPMELDGLAATDSAALSPYLMHLIGGTQSHLPASGLVSALGSAEAPTRLAAAEALRAVLVAFGPRVDLAQAMLPLSDRRRPSYRAAIALHRAQQDRVQAVREEARAAMAVVKDLQHFYRGASEEAAAWDEFLEPRMEARWAAQGSGEQRAALGRPSHLSSSPGSSLTHGQGIASLPASAALPPHADASMHRVSAWLHTPSNVNGSPAAATPGTPESPASAALINGGTLDSSPPVDSSSTPQIDPAAPEDAADAAGLLKVDDTPVRQAGEAASLKVPQPSTPHRSGGFYASIIQAAKSEAPAALAVSTPTAQQAAASLASRPVLLAAPRGSPTPDSAQLQTAPKSPVVDRKVGFFAGIMQPATPEAPAMLAAGSPTAQQAAAAVAPGPGPIAAPGGSWKPDSEQLQTPRLPQSPVVDRQPASMQSADGGQTPQPAEQDSSSKPAADVHAADVARVMLPEDTALMHGTQLSRSAPGTPAMRPEGLSAAREQWASEEQLAAVPLPAAIEPVVLQAADAGVLPSYTDAPQQQPRLRLSAVDQHMRAAAPGASMDMQAYSAGYAAAQSDAAQRLAAQSVELGNLQAMLDAYIKASAAKQAMVSQRLATLERVLVKLHPSAADAFAPLSAVRGMQSSLLGSDSSLGTYLGGATAVPPTTKGGPALTDDDDNGSASSSVSSLDDDVPSPGTRAHVEQMYMEALAADDGEVSLLQLMTMLGPGWRNLRPPTADAMLQQLTLMLQRQEALHLVLPWFTALLDDARAAWRVKPSAGAKAAVMYALETASTALTPADEAHDEASVAAAVQHVAFSWLACYVSDCRAANWLCGPPTLDMATSRMLSTVVVHRLQDLLAEQWQASLASPQRRSGQRLPPTAQQPPVRRQPDMQQAPAADAMPAWAATDAPTGGTATATAHAGQYAAADVPAAAPRPAAARTDAVDHAVDESAQAPVHLQADSSGNGEGVKLSLPPAAVRKFLPAAGATAAKQAVPDTPDWLLTAN